MLAIGRDPGECDALRGPLLTVFAEHPGRVLDHDELLELVWGDRARERDEVKLYVSYLRRKLGDAADVDPVETVRGVGYRYGPRAARSPMVSRAE
ncbi:MAG TPA: helix-turn-helix domain-containing protein [Solirubrobacterales bacterium]|nr:helix-turn-helix domain-containing protein [Solirubrobacterales bacterium]